MPIPYFAADLTTQPTPLDLLVFLGSLLLFGFACFTAGRTIRMDGLRAQRDAAWNEAEQMRQEAERLRKLLNLERRITNCADMDALKAEVERLRADASRYEQYWKESCDERDKLEEDCSRYHHELKMRSEQAATFKRIVECFPEEPSSGVWPHGDSAGEAGWAAAVGTIKHQFGLPSKYIEVNHG